jgi:hypothetical protein
MAGQLKTDRDFLAGLSAYETGWLNDFSQNQKNLFGISYRETALGYQSYQKCADTWIADFGGYVAAATTAGDFVDGLRRARYNSVNPEYYSTVMTIITAMPSDRATCGGA